ncbi:hypothetical protein C8A03DRAFT_35667, partial [Achaetomium macrosporum]
MTIKDWKKKPGKNKYKYTGHAVRPPGPIADGTPTEPRTPSRACTSSTAPSPPAPETQPWPTPSAPNLHFACIQAHHPPLGGTDGKPMNDRPGRTRIPPAAACPTWAFPTLPAATCPGDGFGGPATSASPSTPRGPG